MILAYKTNIPLLSQWSAQLKKFKGTNRVVCKKRIIQLESNVNVEVADQKKTLTIFDDILKATLGELDDQSVDTIAKQLLLLENISITFNNKNVVTKMK